MPLSSPRLTVLFLVVLLGLLPPGLYWLFFGQAPTLTPPEARAMLVRAPHTVLVDVRTPEEFAADHVEGAVNWPSETIAQLQPGQPWPERLLHQPLILLCTSGQRSALAALKLEPLTSQKVFTVRGGLQAWVAEGQPACPLGLAADTPGLGTTMSPTTCQRSSPLYEQWAAVLTGFVVKPLYMALSLVLAILLWRQTSPDLLALRWALLLFFLGEAFCAANYLVFQDGSYLFEYLHSYGMVLSFAFSIYALWEGLDLRLVHFSAKEKRCAAITLCQRCRKHDQVPCGLGRMFLWTIPALAALTILPYCAPYRSNAYVTTIFGTPYAYFHAVIHQFYEIRFLPTLALLLLAISFFFLRWKEKHPYPFSRIFLAAGMGALGFCYFRLVLLALFVENQVWFGFWEEITELLYVLLVAVILWIFRNGLFRTTRREPVPDEPSQNGSQVAGTGGWGRIDHS